MELYRSIARHVLAPAYDRARGTRVIPFLRELEQSQWWSRSQLEETQCARLQRLIHHAYAHVPYYRRLLDEHGVRPADIVSTADLPRLPALTKNLVRSHAEELLADGYPRARLLKGQTGGSTGTPLCFYSSSESRLSHGLARALRAMEWAGIHMGDREVVAIKQGGRQDAGNQVLSRAAAALSRTVYVNASDFSDSTLPGVIRTIRHHRPHALCGYVSAACIVADHVQRSGEPAPEVGEIVVGGEQLFAEQRALLRKVFGREPFSCYSSFENYEIAMECETHSGMHVHAEDLIVEIVDAAGRPAPIGVRGRVLITNLHEYGMPLIRYDTDDESAFSGTACSCGRQLPLIESVTGKTGDIIYTPSGRRLSPLTLGSSGLAPMGIRQFQFIQEALDHVVVRIVPGREVSADAAAALPHRVAAHFGTALGDDVRIEVLVVERIEPTPVGKHLFLISRVTPPATASRSEAAQ